MKHTWFPLVLLLLIGGALLTFSPSTLLAAQTAPASEISIGEQRDISMPNIRLLSLSPDGTLLVGVDESSESGRQLCTYSVESLAVVACADVNGLDSGLRVEDVTWSPDSSRIAFAENAFVYFRDSDIWVMDAQTGALTDLTDEGVRGDLPILGSEDSYISEFFLDVSPAWSGDSESIAFSRTSWHDGEWRGNSIEIIPVSGGETETVIQISDREPGIIYWGIDWQSDGSRFFYNLNHADNDNPGNGIWVVDRDGANNRQIAGAANPDLGEPIVVQVSADGQRLLGYYIKASARSGQRGPHFTLIDVNSGEISDLLPPNPDAPDIARVSVAVLSPDGSKVLTVTRQGEPENQVYVHDLPDGDPVQLNDGIDAGAALIAFGLIPTWATDGSVFITANSGLGTLLKLDGGEAQPTVATTIVLPTEGAITPGATETSSGTEIALGARVSVNDDGVRLRAAPSRDAQAVLDVERRTSLTVLGESVESDGLVWWPVVEPTSKTIGWVRAELITLDEAE